MAGGRRSAAPGSPAAATATDPVRVESISSDGTFRDEFTIESGFWEARDTDADLEAEIKKKIKHGFHPTNTVFEGAPGTG